MKPKKTVAMVVILMGLLGVFAPGASAAPAWYECTIDYLGMQDGACYVQLTDTAGAFTQRWFTLSSASLNQLMAIALTAVSSGVSVVVYTEPTQYSVISGMYLK